MVAMHEAKDQNILLGDGALTLVQSYIAWWDMAGFDQAVSVDTLNWLEQKTPSMRNKNESLLNSRQTVGINDRASAQPNIADVAGKNKRPINLEITEPQSSVIIDENLWPKTLDDFNSAITSGTPLPGNIYADRYIAPHIMQLSDNQNIANEQQKKIMLISDFPNAQDINEKSILSGKQNILIANMMTACGFQNHIIYCSSLASTRPIYDELPEQDLPAIHALMRHHIALLNPDAIICLGSAACNALLGAQLMKSRENLHYFNHNDLNKLLITTFHPRSLLAKPQLKRQAWRDLQILIKKDFL